MAILTMYSRVRETTVTSGTGTVSLAGAVTGYQSFSASVGSGNSCYYCIADQSGPNWECGIGTYNSSGSTLSRTTVLASSNAGALVSFGGATKDVFCDCPAAVLNTLASSSATTATLFTGSTNVTVSGSTGSTLIPSGVGSLTLPANLLVAGKQIELFICGTIGTYTSNQSLDLVFEIAGASVATTGFFSLLANLSGAYWECLVALTCYTAGSSGTVWVNGRTTITDATSLGVGNDIVVPMVNTAAAAVNTTTTNVINLTAAWATAHVANALMATNARLVSYN